MPAPGNGSARELLAAVKAGTLSVEDIDACVLDVIRLAMDAALSGTIASVVNTLLAVIVSFPLLKFWIAPASKDTDEKTA